MDSQAVSFRVDKDDFANAVGWVARSLPAKPAQPVLRGMVITASDEGLELAGFDYEVSTQVKIPAEVNEAGRIAVAGKLLADITAMLPNKPVELRVEGSNVLVTCGSARFEIPVIPLDDYPQLPQLPHTTGNIDPKLFSEAVSQVAIAAAHAHRRAHGHQRRHHAPRGHRPIPPGCTHIRLGSHRQIRNCQAAHPGKNAAG